MPAQTKQSGLLAKYGPKLDAAVKAHAADETNFGIVNLPPGISNGIAKLTKCHFAQYKTGKNEGEYYFRAEGVVVEPTSVEVDGRPFTVAGLNTSVMIPVCDTTSQAGKTTTTEEYVARILNEMRKLGAETAGAGAAQLEQIAAALQEAGPYFNFTTSVRKAMQEGQAAGVWENWNGRRGLDDYAPPEDGGVQDASPAADRTPESAKVAARVTGGKPGVVAGKGGGATGAKVADTYTDADTGGDDIDDLIAQAEDGDTDAQDTLRERAKVNGYTDEDVDATKTWDELKPMLAGPKEADAGADAGAEAAAEEFKPEKGNVFFYGVRDVKTKKTKKVECEVQSVNADTETVVLRNMTDKKTMYKDVPWAELSAD